MEGKVYIVTGGASGIGLATAQKLLEMGASVSVGDIREDVLRVSLAPLQADHADRLTYKGLDVTDRRQVAAFIDMTRQRFQRLDGYANVAGTGGHRLGHEPISATTDDEYNYIMDLNTRATHFALAETLRPNILTEPGGSIVCVGSMFGQRGFKNGAVFAASKHAMVGLVKSAALEAGDRRIRINVVQPGAIDTPMHQKNMAGNMPDPTPSNPIPRLGTPDDIASTIVFLLGDGSSYITGAQIAVDGGANV